MGGAADEGGELLDAVDGGEVRDGGLLAEGLLLAFGELRDGLLVVVDDEGDITRHTG